MLLKLAWRNIWRNRRRSLIVITSVVIGLIAIVLLSGLVNGMLQQMLFNQINLDVSHIQIHKRGFNDNKIVKNFIPGYQQVESVLKKIPGIEAYSKRVIAPGILSSADNSSGVLIKGINPGEESKVSVIKNSIIEGKYLGENKHDIIIGEKLAEKLGVSLGDKVVAMTNTLSGSIGSDVFRIVGIFQTASSNYDKRAIYINAKAEDAMLGFDDQNGQDSAVRKSSVENKNSPGIYYEFAIITNNFEKVDSIKKVLESKLGGDYEVLTYEDLLPMLIYEMEIFKKSMLIINMVIGLALIFGIINSMLMSVFERTNEIGVLMAIGMKNNRLYLMIELEALILGVLGTITGLAAGLLLDLMLAHSGINLSLFSAGLKAIGVGAVIYPALSFSDIINAVFPMPFVAVLGAVYPAYKAIRLQPIYAINYV
jgi:ABC-type lipoprotein release transport system permease subunit